ncbi:MAG: hypothetical protein QOJ34_703 [Pseudonocardiales bacterium]|jgi:uncharacterized protein (TIGR02611 family)|nr:hypothetical protein [Pseudonocardiales bacterium]
MATDDATAAPRRSSFLGRFRARVRRIPGGRLIWRLVVTALGVAVLGVGIILLPLPGPGWLIIFGGLSILASEYAWAARLLAYVRRVFVRWKTWVRSRPMWIRVLMILLSVALLAALIAAGWVVAGKPGL